MWLELIQSDVQFSKSKAPLHPKLIELNFGTELSWICFFKCIDAGPFQLILQIPGPGFEAQGLEFTVFLYWIAYPPIISLKKYVMNTISFFTTSRSTLFLFIEGMSFDNSESKGLRVHCSLIFIINLSLWLPIWLIIF